MFKETIQRLKEKSPKYFVKLRNFAVMVGTSGVAIMTANTTFNLTLDELFIKIVSYVIVVCVGIAGTSQLTKQ